MGLLGSCGCRGAAEHQVSGLLQDGAEIPMVIGIVCEGEQSPDVDICEKVAVQGCPGRGIVSENVCVPLGGPEGQWHRLACKVDQYDLRDWRA